MTHDRKIPSAQSLAIKEICVYFMNKTFFKATQAKYAHTHTHPKKSSYQLFGNFFYKDDKILLSRNFAKNALERIPAHSVEKREIHCHANCFRQINLK